MKPRDLIDALTIAERLKDETRHCYTSKGRHESVAEHSWMMTLMAFFIKDEFPEADMDKVIKMCIIHDLGECFIGDIPTFDKSEKHEILEEKLLFDWVKTLPDNVSKEMLSLYEEMVARETIEAKIYKAIDGMEAVIQHNLSDISTWIPHEYELNKTYANDKVAFSKYLTEIRKEILKDTLKKIELEHPDAYNLKKDSEDYRLHKSGEAMYLTFPAFDKFPELTHLFTTRHGGVSKDGCESWNFGNHSADTQENIYENFRILAEVLNVPATSMVLSQQTHSSNILIVGKEHMGMGVSKPRSYDNIDGLITAEKNLPIITTHADCNSIFFYDPVAKVIGLAHSGWKGTLKHIGTKMTMAMRESFGCRAENLVIGLGPALCQECFEVEEDVATLFFDENKRYREFSYTKGVKTYIDLKKIIKYDLVQIGVRAEEISDMKLCTKCNNEAFFSHRGQGSGRGLMVGAMMLRED